MKESHLQSLVLETFRAMGYKVWKNYLGPLMINGGTFAKNPNAGLPDVFGISKTKPGRLFGIELKSAGGRLRKSQETEIGELRNCGVFIIVGRDYDQIFMEFKAWESKRN